VIGLVNVAGLLPEIVPTSEGQESCLRTVVCLAQKSAKRRENIESGGQQGFVTKSDS
jgi:hypothetical protein